MKKYLPFAHRKGFTLVELLVVMTILITVGGVIISILFISFRGSSKAAVVTTVKQNGNFALSQMVKSIRYAKSLEVPAPSMCTGSTNSPTLTITSLSDNGQITYSCPTDMNDPITSNSASLIDTSAVAVTYCSFTCTQSSVSEPPRVTIQFTLTSKSQGGVLEGQSTIPFQSSVIMRNVTQ